jgi:acyl carrier protein
MSRIEILKEITSILNELREKSDIVLTEDTIISNEYNLDSLENIKFITAIESLYEIRFSLKDLTNWTKIGELIDIVISLKCNEITE